MRITAAVDGSIHSSYSLQTLAHFAPPEELTLVHAMDLPDFNYPMITPELRSEAIEDMKKQLQKEGEGMLDQAQGSVPSDFSNVQRLHQIGHPVDVILETARSSKSHLLMVGARGLGGFKELILGSVSHRVLLHSSCSVMVTKNPITKIEKILLPIEGKDDVDIALKFLALNPFRQPVHIDVFAVWPQPQLPWPTTLGQSQLLEAQAIEEAHARMEVVTSKLTEMNYACEAKVGLGDPAYAIHEQAKSSQADIIMMGTHQRGGLSRFLIGSVSHAVLQHTSCPVILVR